MKKFLVWILVISMLALVACGGNDETSVPETDPNAPGDMFVHYIDVGQGDAIFIEFPNKATMLIDAGDTAHADKVTSYIGDLGYNTIDYVIATHPHAGHIGGLKAVFEKFTVKRIYMTNKSTEEQEYIDLLSAIENEGLKKLPAVAGNTIKDIADNVTGTFLAHRTLSADLHDSCAVFQLTYGNRSFLFMSDAGFEEEESIAWDYKSDVVKVAAHGSNKASSLEFLKNTKASIAVISCGKDNAPAKETLENLDKAGIKQVLRTDEKGDITIKTNGDALEITKGK